MHDTRDYDRFTQGRAKLAHQMLTDHNDWSRRKAAMEEVAALIGKLNTLKGSSATDFENNEIDACIALVQQRNGGN